MNHWPWTYLLARIYMKIFCIFSNSVSISLTRLYIHYGHRRNFILHKERQRTLIAMLDLESGCALFNLLSDLTAMTQICCPYSALPRYTFCNLLEKCGQQLTSCAPVILRNVLPSRRFASSDPVPRQRQQLGAMQTATRKRFWVCFFKPTCRMNHVVHTLSCFQLQKLQCDT